MSSAPWHDVADLPVAAKPLADGLAGLTRQRQRRQAGDTYGAAAADRRLERLCGQLREPLFELNSKAAEARPAAAAGRNVGPVTRDTVFAPVDGWAKIPQGVWLREATAVAVDSTDR